MAARWRIGKRGLACGGCEAVFEPEVGFHSVIVDEAGELRRHDLCDACWESGDREVFCHWRTALPPREPRKRAFDLGLAAELLRRLGNGEDDEEDDEDDAADLAAVPAAAVPATAVPATDAVATDAAEASGADAGTPDAASGDTGPRADRGALAHLLALLLVRKRVVRLENLRGPDGPRARVEFTDGHDPVEIPAPVLGEADVEPLRRELGRLVDLGDDDAAADSA